MSTTAESNQKDNDVACQGASLLDTNQAALNLESDLYRPSEEGAVAAPSADTIVFNAESELHDLKMASGQTREIDDGMDKLLQRMRSDIMFELRNIQHGEKPVTGQEHRNNLQQFMAKHMQANAERDLGKENVPANVDDVAEHRPDAIVIEVQGMIESRPVSSVLQSAAFRRHLEHIIRGSFDTVNRQPNAIPTSRNPNATSNIAINRQTNATSNSAVNRQANATQNSPNNTNLSTQRPSPAPRRIINQSTSSENIAPVRAVLTRSESNESVDSFSSAWSDLGDGDDEVAPIEADEEDHLDAESNPVVASNETDPSVATVPSVQPHDIASNFEHPVPPRSNMWRDITRVHREEFVQEISELLHRRIVSSTLDGEFRTTLEVMAQERLNRSGTDGQSVLNAIRQLPSSGIPRNAPFPFHEDDNNFLHSDDNLPHFNWRYEDRNSPAHDGVDDDDNVSIRSHFSVQQVPITQTNTYLSRQTQDLKKQMNEMKSMLKVMFELQMDVQRSIRQEVAAALSNCKCDGACASAAEAKPSRPVSETHCLICIEKYSDTVLYQCGHMCVCYMCARDLVSRGHNCPVCRAPIKDVIRAYRTNLE